MGAGPTERFVVDASVAVKWHLTGEGHTHEARLILRRFSEGQTQLLAPSHIRYEVPSAIMAATIGRNPRITVEQGRQAIEEFLSLDLQTFDAAELVVEAYLLGHRHHSSFYDALYLALARDLQVPLITADRKFYQQISQLPNAFWIGDYDSGRSPFGAP